MLTGDPPYQGSTAQAVLAKILTDDAPAPTSIRASIPANVDAAIRKTLEKLPADRFSSAQDFSRALADPGFRHGEEPAGVAGGREQWTPVAMAATGSAVLLAMGLGWTLLSTEPPPAPARFEFVVLHMRVTVGNEGAALDVSPDGSRFVFLGDGPSAGQLWYRPLDQLAAISIPGTAGARNPRFSPDGESVAFTVSGRLAIASLSGGPPLTAVSEEVDALAARGRTAAHEETLDGVNMSGDGARSPTGGAIIP